MSARLVVFAWWSTVGQPPYFSLPVGTLDEDGWSAVRLHGFRLTTHPEYITENSVDLATWRMSTVISMCGR